jgi:Glycosyl hydrolase family 79, N-terminal domain
MERERIVEFSAAVALAILAAALLRPSPSVAQSVSLAPSTMPRIGSVSERYQSYNVEMIEVTGGRFWKPYSPEPDRILQQPAPEAGAPGADTPAGMNADLYQYRPPIDLDNARLRKLAAALGPAYVRVSGTWANTTYFSATDQPPAAAPAGFKGVLSRAQWKGVVDFARAVNAQIVTSFATGAGTRDAAGVWTAEQAARLVDYTSAIGGRIAAAEFMNEPNLASMGGAPAGYDAAAYGRDFKRFHAFARAAASDMLILGPGSVGETADERGGADDNGSVSKTRNLLTASRPAAVDAVSYHHYGALSRRCAAMGAQTTADAALSEEWLGRTDATLAFYRKLRDAFAPGKPLWLTETADAACGGNPSARTFLDTFRYLDQLGRLAKQGVEVVAHNTLVASDYGLLDDITLTPKPNYWGALLWRKLMDTRVLESGSPIQSGLHLYAHCLRGTPGGVALLAINNDKSATRMLTVPVPGERYTLASDELQAKAVRLNGVELKLGADDALPDLTGAPVQAGNISLDPATITFIALPGAANRECL